MSIAILSIPLGIIAIIGFIWSINSMSEKPAKGKKKDNDSALIGIIVSTVIFFVSLGIYDGTESTAGLFSGEETSQEQSSQRNSNEDSQSKKSEAQREVEQHNREAVEKAREKESDSNANAKADNTSNVQKVSNHSEQNINLDKQRKAYQDWRNQIESKIQSVETIWSALWTDGSAENIEKLIKSLETTKTQLEAIPVPAELSTTHRQLLNEAANRYGQWIVSRQKACQIKKSGDNNQQDITAEIALGDGLKLRSNVEISNVARELGLSD